MPEAHQLALFDVVARRWRILAEGVTGDTVNWSRNSQYVYADSPQGEKPVIESFRVADGRRALVVSLADLQKVSGRIDFWFGLAPDDSPIVSHRFNGSEIYSLEWPGR